MKKAQKQRQRSRRRSMAEASGTLPVDQVQSIVAGTKPDSRQTADKVVIYGRVPREIGERVQLIAAQRTMARRAGRLDPGEPAYLHEILAAALLDWVKTHA